MTLTSLPIHLEVNSDGGDWETATWFTSVLTDKNKIIWEGNPTGLDHVNVFKETTTTGNFVKIGEIDLTGPEPFEFTDLASDPFAHADSYKISLETTGGSETELSTHQRTIHLSMNRGTDPAGMIKNLIWTPYEGLFVYSYEVWVGGNPNLADMHLHDVVPGTVTSLSIAEFDLFYGAVVAIFEEGPGPKAGGSMKSSSNTINLDPLTTKLKLKIFPNPMTEQATIKFDNPDQEAYLLKIIDLTGKTILEHRNINSNQVNIKRSQLPPGIYQIQLIGTEFASGRIMVH